MRQLLSRTSSSARRLFSVLLVVALVSAACGDDAGSDDDPTGADDTSDTSTSDGDSDDGATDDAALSDPDPVDSATSDSGQDGGASTDDLLADYCDFAAQVEALSVGFAGPSASPEEVEAFIREQLRLSRLGADAAPDTMRDAMTTQVEFLEEAVELLEAAGWDLAAVDDELTDIGSTPERLEALEQLDTFDREACDIRFGGNDTTGPTDTLEVVPPSDTPPSDDPYCVLAAELINRPGLPFDGTAADVEAYYDSLLADVTEAQRLAPESLDGAYQTVSETFAEVYRILDGYDFDLDAAGIDLDAFSSDPAVDEPMTAAVDLVASYDAEACGLT